MGRIAYMAKRLNSLQRELDGIRDEGLKQRRFDELPEGDQRMLDALWGQLFSDRGRKNIPTSGGRWTGKPGESLWIPDDGVVPPDKGYSNMHDKTWRQIKAENGFQGINFSDGRADFRPVTKQEVVFDWERELGQEGIRHIVETGDRQYLHEVGFAMLARKMVKSVQEVKEYKERLNLVWHEEPDCETLRLVVREVHDNIRHFGGVAMLAIVSA
jgi:hypothetical protein